MPIYLYGQLMWNLYFIVLLDYILNKYVIFELVTTDGLLVYQSYGLITTYAILIKCQPVKFWFKIIVKLMYLLWKKFLCAKIISNCYLGYMFSKRNSVVVSLWRVIHWELCETNHDGILYIAIHMKEVSHYHLTRSNTSAGKSEGMVW